MKAARFYDDVKLQTAWDNAQLFWAYRAYLAQDRERLEQIVAEREYDLAWLCYAWKEPK